MKINQNFEQIFFENILPIKVLVQRLSSYKLHWHPQSELIYVVKGSVNVHLEGNNYKLNEGMMIYITGNQIHSISKDYSDNLLIAVQFDVEFFNLTPGIKNCYFHTSAFLNDQNEHPEHYKTLQELVLSIVWQYNKHPQGYQYQLASQAFRILAFLFHYDFFTEQPNLTIEQDRSLQMINRILDYINLNYTEKLSLQEIAEQEHISYYYLSHLFKEITGISFRDHLCNVRLHNSMKVLKSSRESILTIAMKHGFSSAKSYSDAFFNRYGVSPGAYRKKFLAEDSDLQEIEKKELLFDIYSDKDLLYESIDNDADLSYIYLLQRTDEGQNKTKEELNWKKCINFTVDMKQQNGILYHVWSKIGTCGRAADLLRFSIQQQIAKAAKDHGYKYLRFHGIFCDEMMIYNKNKDGTIVYNWLYVDTIFDFLRECNIRPFLELSFMPENLASNNKTIFFYRANISKPDSLSEWTDLVKALLVHCCNRYGREEVAKWYVEVWNEPDYYGVFWTGTMKDYFDLYEASANAVKEVCPDIKVGGPAITHIHYEQNPWLKQFLIMCKERNVPCDFISYHMYADSSSIYQVRDGNIPKMSQFVQINTDEELKLIEIHQNVALSTGFGHLPKIITEWNVSAKQQFCVRDTAFMAPYIINSALKASEKIDALAFWTVTDLIEEVKIPLELYHGGLGLMTSNGIPKSSYWAFSLLNRLGNEIIEHGENYIVTKEKGTIQILAYNLVMLDQIAQRNTDFSGGYEQDPYELFEEQPSLRIVLHLSGLEENYRTTIYTLNRKYGSSYDIWKKMGGMNDCSQEEVEWLKSTAIPQVSSMILYSEEEELRLEIELPPHGCCLYMLKPLEKA